MDDATAPRRLWLGIAALTIELVAVAQAVELHQFRWVSPCRTIAGLTVLVVVAIQPGAV